MEDLSQPKPSEIFGKRLRKIREGRGKGFSQAAVADLMTKAGRPMNKASILRIERGEREPSLDEALGLAWVLGVAPAHLLSPSDDGYIFVVDQVGIDSSALRNWLLFGDPMLLSAEGRRVRARIRLPFELEALARALLDAKAGGDEAGYKAAAERMRDAIMAGARDDP